MHGTFPHMLASILTSPLRRTPQTAIQEFGDIVDRAAFLLGESIESFGEDHLGSADPADRDI